MADGKVPAKVPANATEKMKKETSPMATLPRNAPDYNVPIDMATSYELCLPVHTP
jgi:NADH dehydrogenase (ubiquinone) Fe-S protein 4